MTAYSGGTHGSARETPFLLTRPGARILVVIGHREARIYDMERPTTEPIRIAPYDAEGSGRRLHYVQDVSNGLRKPERPSFYRDIAKAINGARSVLIFGHGTGESSAMAQLVSELKRHHRELASRILGAIVVDDGSLTERQLLAKARELHKTQPAAR